MKTNHGAVINRRMKDNYGEILKRMTPEEKAWAEKFEKLEYAIERGFAPEAERLAKELNPNVRDTALTAIREDKTIKERCNPAKAEVWAKDQQSNKHSDRGPNLNTYDVSDWVRTGGTVRDDDGEETEKGITLSPEDALIDMLDTATKHKVTIEEFMRNPMYHTQERKAGRPKKLESV